MKNERLKKVLKLFLEFSYVVFKQLVALIIFGVAGIIFYETGKDKIFDHPLAANEYCEQREKDLNQIIDDLELELSNINNGDVYGEE